MTLERWSPFTEMRRMDDLFNRFLRSGFTNGRDTETWGIPLDVVRNSDELVIRASLPGIDPEEIDVTVEEGVLTINAQIPNVAEQEGAEYLMRERRTGSFHRAITLPDSVDQSKARSSYKDGVLTVTLPRIESRKARKLAVSVEK